MSSFRRRIDGRIRRIVRVKFPLDFAQPASKDTKAIKVARRAVHFVVAPSAASKQSRQDKGHCQKSYPHSHTQMGKICEYELRH